MLRRTHIAVVLTAVLAAAALPAVAHAAFTLLINGRPLPQGQALVGDDGHLLLSAVAVRSGLGLTVTKGGEGEPWTIRGFGRTLQVRPGRPEFTVEGELYQARVAPREHDGGILIPLEMLQAALEIGVTVNREGEVPCWALRTTGAKVLDLRQGSHRDRARLAIDLDRPTGFSWWQEDGLLVLEVPAPVGQEQGTVRMRLLQFDDPLISQVRQSPSTEGGARLEIAHHSRKPLEVFTLAGPPRIVVDLLREEADYLPPEPEVPRVPKLPRAAGILQVRNFGTPRGPARVFVLDVDPRSQQVEVRPALAGPTIRKRAPVSLICRQHGAYVGINGGFFSYQGPPLGMLVIDGEWIKAPIDGRTVLGITQDGKLLMDRLWFKGRVHFSGLGHLNLTAINRGHAEHSSLVMYTRRWGDEVPRAKGRVRVAVDDTGRVISVGSNGAPVPIPREGFVVSANGSFAPRLAEVEMGVVVTVDLKTQPGWPDLRHAIGGGPRIVKNGKEHVTARPEGFRSDVYSGARPRTAAGITKEGRLLLVAVEGGREGDGGGMTLQELAATMMKLGAEQAMNLDGGGSTTFVVDGKVVNRPSDGCARSVSNAMLVRVRSRQ